VCGQGEVNWDIEDVDGTRRRINTDTYYVPDVGIRLFSPQVYINANKSSLMQIDRNGILFTLKCGTIFRFPSNRIPVIRVLEMRVTVFFTNKNHALNT
jgi:hypothetical protein